MPASPQHDHATLRRGIAILKVLGRRQAAPSGMGVTEIANLIGCDKSQVSRILPVLAASGFVERDRTTRKYRLGWGLHSLSLRLRSPQIVGLARPVVRVLSAQVKESAYLAVLSGRNVLSICNETPTPATALSANELTGSFVPAYCTASGRALLSDFSEEELTELFEDYEFAPRGPNAPTAVAEIYARIVRSRKDGLVIAEDELEADLLSVAVPVRDRYGDVVMALGFSAPDRRIRRRLPAACTAVRAAGRELEHRMCAAQSPASRRAADR